MITLQNIRRAIYNICKRLDIIEQNIGNSGGSQQGGSTTVSQVQADWNQSDSNEVDYIKNKPTIPAEQIQSDWNQTNNQAKDFIKNKPTIPNEQVQANWNESDTNSNAYIQNKPTIPSVPGNESASQGGNTLSVVTTGDKYNWNNKANIWRGTQAQYDAITTPDNNTIYIITSAS